MRNKHVGANILVHRCKSIFREVFRMKVGVIGSGAISDIYLSNMIEKFDNLEVICIASKHPEHAKAKAEKYNIAACSVEELLENSEVEMVVNLTPASVHYELIKKALLAGKHVYTEKTMTDEVNKAKELVELAEEKGLYLGSAPDTFLGAALQTARRAIDDGILGEIHSFAISANRNNDLLLSVFSFLRQPGGGILYDYGVYYLTALTSLFGSVKRVGSVIGRPYPTHVNIMPMSPEFGQVMDTPNESQVSAVLVMENGVTGTLHIDADSHFADQSYFAVYGTKGILYLTDPNGFGGQVRFLPNPANPMKPEPETVLWKFSPYEENSRGIGPSEMADAITHGRKNRASKEMAYHVQEVLDAVLSGGEQGAFSDIQSVMERPELLPQKKVPIKNIGHTSFQMRNEEEMLHFYGEILGMKKLFTLTMGDLLDSVREQRSKEETAGEADGAVSIEEEQRAEWKKRLEDMKQMAGRPWITYMKLADRQYLELFHDLGRPMEHIENRRDNYGYTKCNFEVDSIQEIRDRLAAAGVEIKEDIHPVVDGSLEITVFDPDGNEVQFTQYAQGEQAMIHLGDDRRECCSFVKYTTQVAYQVKDAVNMAAFYCCGLGLKKAMTLTYAQLYHAMKDGGVADEKTLMGLRMLGDQPWIDYIEVAPHQYIELFYSAGEEKKVVTDLSGCDGYQHLCLEVSDIHAAWDACLANGLTPDTPISLGADGAYQFWLVDPDGNRLELMEYAEGAKQLL